MAHFIDKNSSICLLQLRRMLTQRTEFPLSTHTLCGPFDEEFRKKFMGNRSVSLYMQRNKLAKIPSQGLTREWKSQSTKNLLPKIRQIEKIARSNGKKGKKINMYVDGVSDLELYFAKKLVSNQSTKEIIAQIELHQQAEQPSKFTSLSMGDNQAYHSRTTSKFYGKEQLSQSQQGHAFISASKTSYSSNRKWVTDSQFRQQFDKFIIKKPQQQSAALSIFGGEAKESSLQLIDKLQKDKQNLRKIVKKMIQDQNNETEEEQDQNFKRGEKEFTESSTGSGGKSINWILKKCEDYQKKFTIKKGGKKASKASLIA